MRLHPLMGVLMVAAAAATLASPNAAMAEGKYTVAELKETAPDALAPEVRESLGKSGHRVSDSAGKAICELWLRPDLPVIEKIQEQFVMYPIEPGTLVGAVRFPADGSDYRKQKVKAGVYTLRYGHQPQDGNHLGTADYRDFLILLPAVEDKSPAKIKQEAAMEVSKKVSGTTHPAILSLLPPEKGRAKLPLMVHQDTLGLEVLVTKTTGKLGGKTQDVQIELVAVGHGAE